MKAYLNLENWAAAQAVVEEHQAVLFDPAVTAFFAALIAQAQSQGNSRAAANYAAHLQRLETAQRDGIAQAFAEPPEPQIDPVVLELTQGTLAALRGTPADREAWLAGLKAHLGQTSDRTRQKFIRALQQVLQGADPASLGGEMEGEYSAVWESLMMAAQTEGVDPQMIQQVMNNTLAVILQVPDKRAEWMAKLEQLSIEATNQGAKGFAALITAAVGLIRAEGNPTGLGDDLTPFYAGIWAQVVHVLAAAQAGDAAE